MEQYAHGVNVVFVVISVVSFAGPLLSVILFLRILYI